MIELLQIGKSWNVEFKGWMFTNQWMLKCRIHYITLKILHYSGASTKSYSSFKIGELLQICESWNVEFSGQIVTNRYKLKCGIQFLNCYKSVKVEMSNSMVELLQISKNWNVELNDWNCCKLVNIEMFNSVVELLQISKCLNVEFDSWIETISKSVVELLQIGKCWNVEFSG